MLPFTLYELSVKEMLLMVVLPVLPLLLQVES